MARGFDTPYIADAAAKADEIGQAGYEWIGAYLFKTSRYKQLLTRAVAEELERNGLYCVSIWENGRPTTSGYFTTAQGNADGHAASALACAAGHPAGGVIFATVDYDASEGDLRAVTDYFTEMRRVVEALEPAYTIGAYGSGLVCRVLSEAGLVSHTYLSGSTGWAGWRDWQPKADILQSFQVQLFGLDADPCTSNGSGMGWRPV